VKEETPLLYCCNGAVLVQVDAEIADRFSAPLPAEREELPTGTGADLFLGDSSAV
jgi:hypothetical protein